MVDHETLKIFKEVIVHNKKQVQKDKKLPAVLTVKEVAFLMRKSTRTVQEWIYLGDLRSVRIGKSRYVTPQDLLDFIDENSEYYEICK